MRRPIASEENYDEPRPSRTARTIGPTIFAGSNPATDSKNTAEGIAAASRQMRTNILSDRWRSQCSRQGNESRLTPQRPQYVEQVFGIPSGALAAALDGSFVGALAHQVEGEVADHGHVLGAMTGAQA
jgi:hypothetical protein